MWRRDARAASPLTAALSDAEQSEVHELVVHAPIGAAWEALASLELADLPLARALLKLRPGRGQTRTGGPLLTTGPVPAQELHPPTHAVGVVAHRPWVSRSGPPVQLSTVDLVAPGWVVTGTEFTLEAMGPRSTRITTATRCRATDRASRRKMRAYWAVVGPLSGLVRVEILKIVARRAERSA